MLKGFKITCAQQSWSCKGSFLKRHKIPKPDGQPYTERDIRVGENVSMYTRVFRIVDADNFTRDFLSNHGIELRPAESIPTDLFTAKLASRQHQEAGMAHSTCLSVSRDA